MSRSNVCVVSMLCSRNVSRATSGSTSSRMSESVMMLPVRLESRTVSPSRTSVTNWPRMISGSGASAVPMPSACMPTWTDFTCP